VGCDRYREALSARLDGEDDPTGRPAVDRHLAGCAGCRAWLDAVAEGTRLARTSAVPAHARRPPRVVAAAPGRTRARVTFGLRVTLAAIGLAQFLLGAAQIGYAGSAHVHGLGGLGLGSGHLWHESAAWNLALGAGFAFVALRRTRPSGLLPTLTAFVAVLTVLSAGDILAGKVDGLRLASHAFLVAGYLVTLVLARPALDPGEPPAGRGSRWKASFAEEPEPAPGPAPPRLRLISGDGPVPGHARARDRHAA
jgi:predicted anti-sigma-YlaC factor YlaD